MLSSTGSVTINVHASTANHFLIIAPPNAVAGTFFNVTVTPVDPYGNVDTNYFGTVIVSSSDRNPQPSDYTFSQSDNGTHTFVMRLFTAGIQTLPARQATNGSVSGATTIAIRAAAADAFLVTTPPSVVTDSPFDVIITALDPFGNADMNYQGTITFTTSDPGPGVVLPADYTFTTGDGGDNGLHGFPGGVVLITHGFETLTATDKVNGISGIAALLLSMWAAALPLRPAEVVPVGHRRQLSAQIAHRLPVCSLFQKLPR